MQWIESDVGFYVSMGVFSILVFAIGVGVLAMVRGVSLGTREFVGFAVGFTLFMGSYFAAMGIYRLLSE